MSSHKDTIVKIIPAEGDSKRNSASSSSSDNRIILKRTDSLERFRLEHKYEIQEKKYEKQLFGEEYNNDRRAVQYFTSVGIISLTMGFCIYQLVSLVECGDQQAYMGLLTLLLGILVPTPKFDNKEKE